MSDESRLFLETLLSTVPDEGHHTYLWTTPGKISYWHPTSDIDGMVAEAERLIPDQNVYIACGTSRTPLPARKRTKSSDISGIAGLWADIDISDDTDAHKKFNYPDSEKAALSLIDETGVPPTIIVRSGHGLHAWWLFDEFWEFDSPDEWNEAQAFTEAWHTTLKGHAAPHGWQVDAVFDLARILRVPGSYNYKDPENPIHVDVVVIQPEARFGRDHFEGHFINEQEIRDLNISISRNYIVVDDLVLSDKAEVSMSKFESLAENDPRFRASYERTRKDLKDQSGSSYDLSLATIAVHAGWTDQDIADIIGQSRRKHGDKPDKALRPDYIKRTISRAHDLTAFESATEEADEIREYIEEAKSTGDDDEARDARRKGADNLSQRFTFFIVGVIKLMTTPPQYQLLTPTGPIDLGSAREMMSWTSTSARCADALNILIPRFKPKEWDAIIQMILTMAEEVYVGIDGTESGRVRLWVDAHLASRPPITDRHEALIGENPFVEAGSTFIFGSALKKWLWLSEGEHLNIRDLQRMLKAYGCISEDKTFDVDGQSTKRSVWRLPQKGDG